MKNKLTRKTDHKKKKNKEFFFKEIEESKIFFGLFEKNKRQFLKRPKKKIDTRKSREVISRSATNQKKKWNTQGNSTTQGGK